MYEYVRYEKGVWFATRDFGVALRPVYMDYRNVDYSTALNLDRNDPLLYKRERIFYDVVSADVFNTFCMSGAIGGTGNPVRLVFASGDKVGLTAWMNANNIQMDENFTQITIRTDTPLPLAEDYTRDVYWSKPLPGDREVTGIGCPRQMMEAQGAAGREYVVNPDLIQAIQVGHLTRK